MPFLFPLFLFLAAAVLAQSAWSLRDGYRFLAYLRSSLRAALLGYHPPAAVVVPVRGIEPGFEANIEALFSQEYPDYRLIFCLARETDPAHDYLAGRVRRFQAETGHGPRRARVVIAGVTAERGEKVNNLLAALRAIHAEDPSSSAQPQVLVFADADAHPRSNWLRSLIDPLGDPAVTVSTGFRWYLPGAGAASRLRAAWDTSIATLLGGHRSNFAWGGSMAVRAEDFRRLRVAERYWASTVSDDYGLTRAVRDSKGWIRFEPRCLVPSSDDVTFGEFLSWANRQIIITRVYARHLWAWGLASHILFCASLAVALAEAWVAAETRISLLALGAVISILLLGLAKARLRTRVARLVFPDEPSVSELASCYWRWWPLVPWVMLFNFVTAGLTRRIEWCGTEYELLSSQEVRVIQRHD